MKKFETVAIVTLTDGVVELSDKQAGRRVASLKRKGKTSQYEILTPVQFKYGEVIGMKSCPKGMESLLSEVKAKGK